MKTATKTIKTLGYLGLIPSISVRLSEYFLHYSNKILCHAGSLVIDKTKTSNYPKLGMIPAYVIILITHYYRFLV